MHPTADWHTAPSRLRRGLDGEPPSLPSRSPQPRALPGPRATSVPRLRARGGHGRMVASRLAGPMPRWQGTSLLQGWTSEPEERQGCDGLSMGLGVGGEAMTAARHRPVARTRVLQGQRGSSGQQNVLLGRRLGPGLRKAGLGRWAGGQPVALGWATRLQAPAPAEVAPRLWARDLASRRPGSLPCRAEGYRKESSSNEHSARPRVSAVNVRDYGGCRERQVSSA